MLSYDIYNNYIINIYFNELYIYIYCSQFTKTINILRNILENVTLII